MTAGARRARIFMRRERRRCVERRATDTVGGAPDAALGSEREVARVQGRAASPYRRQESSRREDGRPDPPDDQNETTPSTFGVTVTVSSRLMDGMPTPALTPTRPAIG